ncbi:MULTISPECIES: membrane protein [unclassified Streptomyces]|uniref:membrane protein n=1 Tax=unclassified Streptomyces TaxID=2593676 RepID=UPI0004C84E30|nr:membrane protein [Streptomyces sp. NRRL S-118]
MPAEHPVARRPRRETVTGVPRAARRPPRPPRLHAPARSEISEQTSLGHTYVRSLMRSQLRAALYALGTLALLVGTLPLLFALPEALDPAAPSPAPFVWAALGVGVHPVMWLTARWYVRRAERNERAFTGLVEGR